MRDPNRIPEIIDELKVLWEANPDLRLGQLIINAINPGTPYSELFYIEDDKLLTSLHKLHVLIRANSVFKNYGEATAWLRSPCFVLGNRTPEQLLDTAEGVELVMNALGRIEIGDIS